MASHARRSPALLALLAAGFLSSLVGADAPPPPQPPDCSAPTGPPCFAPIGGNGDANVFLDHLEASHDWIKVVVRVRDVPGVYGSAFRVEYDPDYLRLEGYEMGALLEIGDRPVLYAVSPPNGRGSVTVGVTRLGDEPGAALAPSLSAGPWSLVIFRFRGLQPGWSYVRFFDGELYDEDVVPIEGLIWAGGRITVR
jgi:hypothetical protein